MERDDDVRALYLSGDPAGLDAAYRAYGQKLYAVARSVLGEDGALDCVHDVLLRVWQRPSVYRAERGALRAFLQVSVRNEAISRKRSSARHFEIERGSVATNETNYGFDVTDHIERAALRAAVESLPIEQRTALSLAYFNHLTQAEIAARLNEPLGTIKSRLGLAMRKLQRALATPEGAL